MQSFVERLTPSGEVYGPDERITGAEALYAYTAGSAAATGTEGTKGRLVPGMLADLVFLDQDPTAVEPSQIGATQVLATMVGGETPLRRRKLPGPGRPGSGNGFDREGNPMSTTNQEFLADFATMSGFGATAGGGVDRQAGTTADHATRRWFGEWLAQHGFSEKVDAAGNQFGTLDVVPGAPYVLLGSHLDSQPLAGRYDGAYGVLAGAHARGRRGRGCCRRARPRCTTLPWSTGSTKKAAASRRA